MKKTFVVQPVVLQRLKDEVSAGGKLRISVRHVNGGFKSIAGKRKLMAKDWRGYI